MTRYTSFAVVGAGLIGLPVVEALSRKSVSLVVLTRPGSSPKTLPANVKVATVDLNDQAAVTKVFEEHKVEVVISTVGYPGLASQTILADAAKATGVKLFAPSEFGMPTEGFTEGVLGIKNDVAEHLRSIDLPSVRFYTGYFTHLVPFVVAFNVNGKINVVGKSDRPVSFTAIEDIGGFVAHVLTTLPPSELDNTVLRIQGDRSTLAGLAPLFKTTVEYVETVPGESGALMTYLQGLIETGLGSTGWDKVANQEGALPAGSANYLWEGHQWKTIKSVHNL